MLEIQDIKPLVLAALKEDMPFGDITTDGIISDKDISKAYIIAKQKGVIAGLNIAEMVFKQLDSGVLFESLVQDGQEVDKQTVIAKISGNTKVLLKGERTALNFLQHLSGIATKTKAYCDKIKGTKARIVDTRKTTPGLRLLEKYAVTMGGGSNHRFCLSDGVLIKDNHIKAAGGVEKAIEMVRKKVPHTTKIEVETETLEQVQEAINGKPDTIMLDNMGLDTIKKAVKIIDGNILVEISGNVSLDTVRDYAVAGADIISVGELTHSVVALDLSMKIE